MRIILLTINKRYNQVDIKIMTINSVIIIYILYILLYEYYCVVTSYYIRIAITVGMKTHNIIQLFYMSVKLALKIFWCLYHNFIYEHNHHYNIIGT